LTIFGAQLFDKYSVGTGDGRISSMRLEETHR